MPAPALRAAHRLLLGLVVAAVLLSGAARVGHVQAPPTFASRVAQLSEPGGYFDTDNLISNERSYLHVVPALRDPGLAGGAYIGVGPDQNFSYIAQVKPNIAFIVDLRRDNLLLHLVFKALFSLSETRVDYLSLLFGRARSGPSSPTGGARTSTRSSATSRARGWPKPPSRSCARGWTRRSEPSACRSPRTTSRPSIASIDASSAPAFR